MGKKTMAVVFDAIACFNIEIDEGMTYEEAEDAAYEWLDAHLSEVASEIEDCEIRVKEIYR